MGICLISKIFSKRKIDYSSEKTLIKYSGGYSNNFISDDGVWHCWIDYGTSDNWYFSNAFNGQGPRGWVMYEYSYRSGFFEHVDGSEFNVHGYNCSYEYRNLQDCRAYVTRSNGTVVTVGSGSGAGNRRWTSIDDAIKVEFNGGYKDGGNAYIRSFNLVGYEESIETRRSHIITNVMEN